jgi:ABC-type iron transport system FetAB ATPase subunit
MGDELRKRGTSVPLVETRAVTRILPGIVPTTLVRDVSLTIGEQEFVAITGPSGPESRRCFISLACSICQPAARC